MSPCTADFYEAKRSQRHLLAAFENNWLEAPIDQIWRERYQKKDYLMGYKVFNVLFKDIMLNMNYGLSNIC